MGWVGYEKLHWQLSMLIFFLMNMEAVAGRYAVRESKTFLRLSQD